MSFVCIHCGEEAAELYRQYSATVLKLKQCVCLAFPTKTGQNPTFELLQESCGRIVDEYMEYDLVLVLLDLLLQRLPAYRHLLFNSGFKVIQLLLHFAQLSQCFTIIVQTVHATIYIRLHCSVDTFCHFRTAGDWRSFSFCAMRITSGWCCAQVTVLSRTQRTVLARASICRISSGASICVSDKRFARPPSSCSYLSVCAQLHSTRKAPFY